MIDVMWQGSVISDTVVCLGRRSFTHRMEVAKPNGYRVSQLAALNRDLSHLHDLLYDDWRSVTEEDYAVFGG